MRRLLARCAAATTMVAAAVAVPALPASAATCSTATGVSVVVDFGSLGGGIAQGCVSDGGGDRASSLFPDAGYPLTYVASGGGFVCRVSGKPADDPCQNTPPADRYWGLWWSDGTSGSWSYSSRGVGSLRVPDGGSVAFAWQDSSGRHAPGVAPPTHQSASATPTPKPTPKPTPTTKPTPKPTHQPKPSVSASAQPQTAPSTSPTSTASAAEPTVPPPTLESVPATSPTSPSESPSVAAATADPADTSGGGGLPAWVGPAVVVALFGAGGAAVVVRRRRMPKP